MEMENKTFIITGGASGLGLATVKELSSHGANIVIADLNSPKESMGENVRYKSADVSSEKSVNELCDYTIKEFNEIHGLINCAGIVIPEKLIDKEGTPHQLKTFQKTINVNLIGTFNASRIVSSIMAKRSFNKNEDNGIIINTASIAAFEGQVGQTSYSASKSAIVGMTLPMARELSQFGIRVVTIAPGIFETPMLAGLPEKVRDSLGAQVPFPSRLGKTSEYASLVAHIITNQMINGETIRIDGAIRMSAR